jgi:5-methylcytosine-specific restriction enzyme subunit McrC
LIRQSIVLGEYQQSEDVAASAQVARALDEAGGGRITVGFGFQPGTIRVTAGHHVGTIVTPELELLIRPKVPLENLFTMLSVGMPAEAWQREAFRYGSDRNLLPALAAFFARTLERALATGLRRDYRPERERLVALRGRVDVVGQFRNPGVLSPIACSFDEYTADIDENRYLRAAVRHLLRVPGIRPDTRKVLQFELARFEDIADVAVDPDLADRIRFTRLNRHYEPAIRLAALVLRNLTLIDRAGAADAASFLLDMNDLFQRWVTDRLRTALRSKMAVKAEPTVHLGNGRRVAMNPDLTFVDTGAPVYVADVKYKLTTTGAGRSGDYYQLLAYTTAMNLPEGVLIYCQDDGLAPEREVVVRHAGKRLWTYPLPLAGSPKDVERAVDDLAAWIVQRRRLLNAA